MSLLMRTSPDTEGNLRYLLMRTSPDTEGNLRYFWKDVMEQYSFARIRLEIPCQKLTDEELKAKSGFRKINRIHQTDDTIIIMNKKFKYGKVFVVSDSLSENRYFIAFDFRGYYTISYLAGVIVYFDQVGKMTTPHICMRTVCEYDWRNGLIVGCLYNQSLVFFQAHRDCGYLMIFASLLSYEDNVIRYTSYMDSDIQFRFGSLKNMVISRFFSIENNLKEKSETTVLIDLASLKSCINHYGEDCLELNYYFLEPEKTEKFIHLRDTIPVEYYGDGYPIECGICCQPTVMATYRETNLTWSLGSSFCSDCLIRFSQSSDTWECCRIRPNGQFCHEKLAKGTPCAEIHSDTKFKMVLQHTSLKYPFRKNYVISKQV